jgi:hypothetical protein
VACRVADIADLVRLLTAIAETERTTVSALLDTKPSLVTARLARRDEFFIESVTLGSARLRNRSVARALPRGTAAGALSPRVRAPMSRQANAV